MRRLHVALLLLLVFNLGLLLLGPKTTATSAPTQSPLRVGLVFDIGGIGDKSFNDSAYRGIERARHELGVSTELIEPGEGADREAGLRLLAARGFDLVIGVGFVFSDDMYTMAREYPNIRFACIDYAKFDAHGFVQPPPNLVALKFREEQGAFLVGALAALSSHSHVLGFVGGMDIPLIHKFEAGFAAGAAAVCPDCRVLRGYAGVTPEAFKNPAKGKELALTQYGRGADIIFHASGSTGLGVFAAARATDRYAIGVDADQWDEAPGHVLTSMTKQIDVAVFNTIRDAQQGKFQGGVRVLGLDASGVDYVYDARNRPLIAPGVRERVEALRRALIRQEITVPVERRAAP